MTNKGVEEFFGAIKERCSNDDEYAVELIKARGFLLENGEMIISDNAHPSDEAFLNMILQAEHIGKVKDGKIVISSIVNIENIFNVKYVGGCGALCNKVSWQIFLHDSYAPKVSISLLEPFVARYIKAISACGVMTCNSCDGNHPGTNRFGRIVAECNDDCSGLWNKIIVTKCLNQRFNLNWDDNYETIKFNMQNQWRTYIEFNRAAEYLYDNRILLRRIRRGASDGISNSMAVHLPAEELAAIFTDRASKLMDGNQKRSVSPMTKERELDLMCRLALTKDREESISLAMQLFPEMTRKRAAEVTDKVLGTEEKQ